MTIDDEADAEAGDSKEEEENSDEETSQQKPVVRGDSIPYTRIFDDLDKVFEEVSQDLSKTTFSDSVKMAKKAIDSN